MDQQIQQEQFNSVQSQKKQKSLLWIIVVLYLAMLFSGIIFSLIVTKIIIAKISLDLIGGEKLPNFLSDIIIISLFFVSLVAHILALFVGINYVAEKTIISKAYVVKISLWLAIIIIIVPVISRIISLRFSLWDLLVIVDAAVVYFVAKHFLNRKAT